MGKGMVADVWIESVGVMEMGKGMVADVWIESTRRGLVEERSGGEPESSTSAQF